MFLLIFLFTKNLVGIKTMDVINKVDYTPCDHKNVVVVYTSLLG